MKGQLIELKRIPKWKRDQRCQVCPMEDKGEYTRNVEYELYLLNPKGGTYYGTMFRICKFHTALIAREVQQIFPLVLRGEKR